MPRDDIRTKSNTSTILLVAVVVALAAGVLGIGVGFMLGKGGAALPAPQSTKVMTREEFKTSVMGKTQDEVIKAVGKPDKTSESDGKESAHWYYDGRTKDPLTGKVDSRTSLWFERGVVVNVVF